MGGGGWGRGATGGGADHCRSGRALGRGAEIRRPAGAREGAGVDDRDSRGDRVGGGRRPARIWRNGCRCGSPCWPRSSLLYADLLAGGPRFHSPDAHFDAAFDLARANLQALEAESRALGRYFYAGLQTFPFWFSADGAYDTPGLLAAGFASTGINHLLIGTQSSTRRAACRTSVRPPARSVVQGNAAETPLWVMALWDAYRWTGDRAFLEAVYPAAVQGLLDYTLGSLDRDGDGYPCGPGLVEREDMGAKKLDSAAYTWAALRALEQMAGAMGDTGTAARARARGDAVAAGFDAAWWDPDGRHLCRCR